MKHIQKVTPEYYAEVRRSLKNTWKWTRFTKRHINDVAYKHGISYKTVVQIKNSPTYEAYQEQNKAQHPDNKQFSLREHILVLHKMTFDKGDNTYKEPLTARTAIVQLEYELGNK
jgi:hypothetical protein